MKITKYLLIMSGLLFALPTLGQAHNTDDLDVTMSVIDVDSGDSETIFHNIELPKMIKNQERQGGQALGDSGEDVKQERHEYRENRDDLVDGSGGGFRGGDADDLHGSSGGQDGGRNGNGGR